MSFRSRQALAVCAAVGLGWLIAFATPRDFTVGSFVDDAHYAVLAKALREQHTYRTINLPDAPAETKYPPGLPALLALAWSPDKGDAANLNALRWVNLALLGPLMGVLTALAVGVLRLTPTSSLALVAAGLLSPGTATLWTVPLSEPLFLLLVGSGLALAGAGKKKGGLAFLIAAVYVRTLALPFLIAAVIVPWYRNKELPRLELALVLAGLAPLVLWQLFYGGAVPAALYGSYGSYGSWYLDSLRADWLTVLVRVPFINVWQVLTALGTQLLGGLLPGIALGAVGIFIVWRLWAGRLAHGALTVGALLYLAAILVWPFPPERFIAGAWPLLLLGAAASIQRHAGTLAVLALLVSGIGFGIGGPVQGHRVRGESADALIATVRPIIPGGSTVATSNPGLHYLMLDVQTVPNQRMRSYRAYRLRDWSTAWGLGDDLWEIVRHYEPQFLLIERRGVEGRFAVGSLQGQCPTVLEQLWESPASEFLFRVHSSAACTPDVTAR